MAHYQFTIEIDAPVEVVFDLWTNLDRMREWVGGVTKVTDATGRLDRAGTRFTVWFGPMKSPTEVLEVTRPSHFRSRFGNWLLRGENGARFESIGGRTRLVQDFRTVGLIPAIMAWIWSRGSYRGSFEGELREFARLAEGEARAASDAEATDRPVG